MKMEISGRLAEWMIRRPVLGASLGVVLFAGGVAASVWAMMWVGNRFGSWAAMALLGVSALASIWWAIYRAARAERAQRRGS